MICEEDPYLLELTRRIHLNPLRAGIVQTIDEPGDYPFTGHSAFMIQSDPPWQDKDRVPSYFGKTETDARLKCRAFVEEGISMGKRPDLTGGGLLRSQGGWANVVSMRRRHTPEAGDNRILGSGTLVGTILAEAEQKRWDTFRLRASIPDLPSLAQRIADKEGVNLSDLLSGVRRRPISRARRLLRQIALKKLVYSGASVTRFFGVSISLVNRMGHTEAAVDLDGWMESSL